MWGTMDSEEHEVATKTPTGLGDVRKPGQRRKHFGGGDYAGR